MPNPPPEAILSHARSTPTPTSIPLLSEDERPASQESWFEEIRRRGLWQAAAGYLAAGWAVIEVVSTLVDRAVVPDSMFQGALIVVALGFPVVLATAYVQSPSREGSGRRDWGAMPASIARRLTWRNAVLGGVGAFALLGLATAGSTVMRVTGIASDDVPAIAPDRIAILPFEVRGSPDLAYLGEGLVDLLSAKLGGAGTITTVDPRVVIAGATTTRVDLSDPAAADGFAASLRAGRFVTGSLLESGGNVRLTASLHQTGKPDAPLRQASAEGGSEEIFGLIDGLVARLLATTMSSGESDRLQALATVTSGSLDATKAYLQGERFLRGGQYREAAEAYERAIELDSAFALAYYRRSIAADWTDAYDIRSSAEQALKYADRLSPRDRGMVEALRLRRNGRIEESEQAFRALLHADPDDLEALVQYGELLFHDVGRRGRSTMESIPVFRRAVEIEPANLIAHLHLARLYALADSTDRLEETAEILAEQAPESERAVEVDAMRAWARGDTALQRSVKERLEGNAWYFRFYAVHGVSNYGRNAAAGRELLVGREAGEPLLESLAILLDVEQGRQESVRAAFARPALADDPTWNLYEAFLLTSGTVSPDTARMTALAAGLAGLDGEEILRTAWLPPYEDRTVRFAEFERDYFRARLLAQLGRTDEAGEVLGRMRTEEEFTGLGTVKADAERSIEVELRLGAGDRTGALEVLRSMENQVPHALTVRPLPDESRARLLRGELEMELGDPEIAQGFLRGLDESWSPWDAYHRPQVYVLMGRMAEDAGRADEAIQWYTRFIDLWADCDPGLLDRRAEIEARRNALVRAVG